MGELINGRTPEEIKRGLRWIAHDCDDNGEDCNECECVEECHKLVEDDVARDALALIQHLEAQQPKWISVQERLPEMYDDGSVDAVLVTDGFLIHMAYYVNGEWVFCESGEMEEPMFYCVTHWMQLPKSPEEEG